MRANLEWVHNEKTVDFLPSCRRPMILSSFLSYSFDNVTSRQSFIMKAIFIKSGLFLLFFSTSISTTNTWSRAITSTHLSDFLPITLLAFDLGAGNLNHEFEYS